MSFGDKGCGLAGTFQNPGLSRDQNHGSKSPQRHNRHAMFGHDPLRYQSVFLSDITELW